MAALLPFPLVTAAILNTGGVPYKISNPSNDSAQYSTDFEHNVDGRVEHFDVYGTVQTRYSQVYWTRNAPIELPPALVKRFEGKVMAITGYEVDQVRKKGDKDFDGSILQEDVSVPINIACKCRTCSTGLRVSKQTVT